MIAEKKFRTGDVARVTWPRKFWTLNTNSSKMAKDTNVKFGMLKRKVLT